MIQLKDGTVEVKLRPDLAPKHVEQITKLANEGFYDGIIFHRVIPGFMAQTGDPTGTGRGGSKLPDLKDFLNGQYTVFGEVTKGMDLVDNIAKGEPPANPDKMIKVRTSDKF